MVRAVMRTMLFRSGRKPGAPVRRSDLVAAVDAAYASGAGRGGTGAPAGGRGRPSHAVPLSLALARATFARDLALDMARVDILPLDGRGGGGGGGGGGGVRGGGNSSTEAYCLRTLLPPPALAASAAAGGVGARPPHTAALGLLAAALVRLGGSAPAVRAGGGGGGGGRGGPAGPGGGPGWMVEGELWALLSEVGARQRADGPGALEAAWAGLGGSGGSPVQPTAAAAEDALIPGVGDPAAALKAALDGRWLVERWGPPPPGGDGGANAGGRARWYGIGETAAGGDGALDAFIRLLFESPDPAADLGRAGWAARRAGGGGRGAGG